MVFQIRYILLDFQKRLIYIIYIDNWTIVTYERDLTLQYLNGILWQWWSAIRVASQESLKGILQMWWSAIRVAFWRHFWLYTRMMYISEIDDRNLYVICISVVSHLLVFLTELSTVFLSLAPFVGVGCCLNLQWTSSNLYIIQWNLSVGW